MAPEDVSNALRIALIALMAHIVHNVIIHFSYRMEFVLYVQLRDVYHATLQIIALTVQKRCGRTRVHARFVHLLVYNAQQAEQHA